MSTEESIPYLRRYSKPRGPGDQTSGGRGKLLRATSGISRVEILVRETLQNSWDARDDEWYPAYGVRVYRVQEPTKELLRTRVFTELSADLSDLSESLAVDDLHAIEIYDRGTSGLDGPYRASEEPSEGEPNNFNSFVFDIGTTKESAGSGGTYGFGKTATFEVSRPHSVVYWSRCRLASGELEYRLIAAALHDPYAVDGVRYTGAHWWGDPSELSDIVPLRGEEAERLGLALFRTHFGEDETGTSILVIDPEFNVPADDDSSADLKVPVRTDESADLLVEQIASTIAHSAWPKAVPQENQTAPMRLDLYKNGVEQDLAAGIRQKYHRFSDALIHIRKAQDQQDDDTQLQAPPNILREHTYPIRLRPRGHLKEQRLRMFGGRADNIVGHLHLVESADATPPAPDSAPRNTLCLMRSTTELVVRYDDVVESDSGVLQWHGVFKPTPECDAHFASSEPPTHDGWMPQSADDEISTYVVSKTLDQIRTRVREFLSQGQTQAPDGERSTRGVATSLRMFVPLSSVGAPPEVDHASVTTRGRRRARKQTPSATIEVTRTTPLSEGLGQVIALLPTSTGSADVLVSAAVYALGADGKLALNTDELTYRWIQQDVPCGSDATCKLIAGVETKLELRTRVASALEVELTAEEFE